MGFDNYNFSENSLFITFLVFIRIANSLYDEIQYITLQSNINYYSRLRNLENDVEITCHKQNKNQFDIYSFNCSKQATGRVSRVEFIDNSIKINGQNTLNYQELDTANFMGKNIQNQKSGLLSKEKYTLENSNIINGDETFTIEGENNYTSDLNSNNSYLLFIENDAYKNISCKIQNLIENNKFKVVCTPESSINADLNLNNMIDIKDQNKTLILSFKGGNSKPNLTNSKTLLFNHNKYLKKNGGLKTGGIVAIILLSVFALAAIASFIILCKPKSKPNVIPNPDVNTFMGLKTSTFGIK